MIVVPCFNEAARLDPAAFAEQVDHDRWLGFLLVNDGSTDATADVLAALSAERPEAIRVLNLPANRGKAEAVRAGVLAAARAGATLGGFWDADLATPLCEIRPMVELLLRREALMVLGSRVKLLGRTIRRQPHRHYLGRIFATCASAVLGLPVYDTQCGAKVFRLGGAVSEAFAEPFLTRWAFDVELLARITGRSPAAASLARARGHRRAEVVEYPVHRWEDRSGSTLGPLAWPRVGAELALVALRYGRR